MMFVRRVCLEQLQFPKAGIALFIGLISAAALFTMSPAQADEKITYLFPAPPLLPAFGPIQLAKGKGYFSQAGLDVTFAVGRGGVDVAKEGGVVNVQNAAVVGGEIFIARVSK